MAADRRKIHLAPHWFGRTMLLFLVVLLETVPVARPAAETVATGPSPDSIRPISRVRIDADNDHVPDRRGDTVTVAGRIVAERGVFYPEELVSLQGPTAGIHISLPKGPVIERGDSVQVRGIVEHKYGLTQLQALEYRIVSGKTEVPAPLPLTVASAQGEANEGEFARIRGRVLRVTSNEGGKLIILGSRDEKTSAQIMVFVPNRNLSRIDPGRFEAGDELEVTGVLGQHDYEVPYTDYYQVIPREAADLTQIGRASTYLRTALYILLGGGVLAVVAVVMLRAAVKRRTRELSESQSQLKRLAEATFEGIIIHDDGQIIDVNEALVEMVGRDRDDLIGREMETIFGEVMRDLGEDESEGNERDVTEAEIVREDGQTIPVEVETKEGTTEDRSSRVVALRDISKRKEWEEGILRAKHEAEEAARLKSAMLANMSHEIRTPLTSIIGFSEVLKENLGGDLAEFAEKAHDSSQRLMKTLDSVLHLSKLEAGILDLEREPVRLGQVVQETVNLLRPRAEEKSVTIETAVSNGGVEGVWNEGAVNRIVENLLGNAIKFTPEGGDVEVRVRKNGTEAILEVEDTGVGIEEEAQHRIFNAFEQESGGVNREYEGSGLGLSIVRRLTEVHGGTIDVESIKGEGSTFIVTLPLSSSDEVLDH